MLIKAMLIKAMLKKAMLINRVFPPGLYFFVAILSSLLTLHAAADSSQEIPESNEAVNNEEIPLYIAVLPATGSGETRDKADIRLAIHNALGASQYELMKPKQVDKRLISHDLNRHKSSNEELCEKLGVDGLLLLEVNKVEKFYAAAYAHYKVDIKTSLYSLRSKKVIWQWQKSETKREGGIATDPISFLTTAFTSSRILTDAVRLQLIDTLARKFSQKIPQPDVLVVKKRPPKIQQVLTNASDGPFKAGEEIRLFVQAEPKLAAWFKFDGEQEEYGISEIKPGEYHGRYVVKAGENSVDKSITLFFKKQRNEILEWPVAGLFSADTKPPSSVEQLSCFAQTDGARLQWSASELERLKFHIDRAEAGKGEFTRLETTDLQYFQDGSITLGKNYLYRVTAEDAAGNFSPASTTKVYTVRYGPTDITNHIKSSTVLKAAGSPYRINTGITVLKRAQLKIEPGTILELGPNSKIQIQGQLLAQGTAESPIIFKGESWTLQHEFSTKPSMYKQVRFSGVNSLLKAESASLILDKSSFQGTAVHASNKSQLKVSGIRIHGAERALTLEHSRAILSHSEISGAGNAIDAKQSMLEIDGLFFNNNHFHIHSDWNVEVKSSRFADSSLELLLGKVSPAVKVHWNSFDDEYNLQKQWLVNQWRQVAGAIQSKDWARARLALTPISKQINLPLFHDVNEAVYLMQNPAAKAPPIKSAELLTALLKAREAGRLPGLIWLPSHNDFQKGYLEQNFNRALAEGVLSTDGLNLNASVIKHKNMRSDDLPYDSLGTLYLVDRVELNGQLKQAGFIRRSPLFANAELIQPLHPLLCQTANPWVQGEKAISDRFNYSDCFALSLNVLDSNQLFLFGENPDGLTRLLPNECHSTGMASNRVSGPQKINLPQNANRQAASTNFEKWPFREYWLIAVDSPAALDFIKELSLDFSSPCIEIKTNEKNISTFTSRLKLADKALGGHLQWTKLVLP